MKDVFTRMAERDACPAAPKTRLVQRYQVITTGRVSSRLHTRRRAQRAVRLALFFGLDAYLSSITVRVLA